MKTNKLTKLLSLFVLSLLPILTTLAADLPALTKLYKDNYQNFYRHGMCGQNILRLVEEAHRQKIDLTNAYVLKIEGAGFLETSGFYSRHGKDQRTMLGYFHVILVADNKVFDFDLADQLVPTLERYVRLQFTPPYERFTVFGIPYVSLEQLPWWTATRYEWHDYISNAPMTWKKKLGEIVDLKAVMSLPRSAH